MHEDTLIITKTPKLQISYLEVVKSSESYFRVWPRKPPRVDGFRFVKLSSKIVEISECQTFSSGEIIIHEGDQGDSFYKIISGLTRVFQVSEDGIEVTLVTLGPGEGFGEMALLTGELVLPLFLPQRHPASW